MSLISNLFLKQIKQATADDSKSTRLAIISSVKNGNAYVTFYGETEPSLKPQKHVSSYQPAVGDKVMMQLVGNSYVITGKVV